MSSTAFQILAAGLAGVLVAAPALASGNVKSNPTRVWADNVLQGIAVRMVRATRVSSDACGEQWSVTFEFECLARGVSGTDPAESVDALLAAVAERIGAADLAPLNVVERDPQASVQWDFDAAASPFVSASLLSSFVVHTAIDRLTPTTP